MAAFEAALVYRTAQTRAAGLRQTQWNLGIVYEDLGDLPAAIACSREAETYYRLMGYVDRADDDGAVDRGGGGEVNPPPTPPRLQGGEQAKNVVWWVRRSWGSKQEHSVGGETVIVEQAKNVVWWVRRSRGSKQRTFSA